MKYIFGVNSGDKRTGSTVGTTNNVYYTQATINTDGTITTSNMGLVAYDETLKNPLGWWEKMSLTTLTPAKASAKKALKAKKTKVTKNTKVKKVRVTKRIRH